MIIFFFISFLYSLWDVNLINCPAKKKKKLQSTKFGIFECRYYYQFLQLEEGGYKSLNECVFPLSITQAHPSQKKLWFYSVQRCTIYDAVFRVRMKCDNATIKETDDCSSLCLPPFTAGWLMTIKSPRVGEQNIDWGRRFTPRLLNMEAFPDMTNIARNWVWSVGRVWTEE